ncbi:hypothetical protein CRU92_03985 [Arcobacter sp. FW59]|nr:hypothetical protein CRU92_03985 [Arcobacter sp. FW59]
MNIEQYNIYEIDLSGTVKDDEIPENVIEAVVLSPDEMNDILKTIVIAPLCNKCALTPTTFLIDKELRIRVDQISAVQKRRVTKYIGKVDKTQIPKIKNVLNEMLIK